MAKQNVIFDFDGVIHSYTSGWKGADVIADPPVAGIREVIKEIREHYRVVVVSTRCYSPGGIEAIKAWLFKHDIEVDNVTGEKPPAILTIDDRALCFDGDGTTLLEQIRNFQPWYKQPRSSTTSKLALIKCNNGLYVRDTNIILSLTDNIHEAMRFGALAGYSAQGLAERHIKMLSNDELSFTGLDDPTLREHHESCLEKLHEHGCTIIDIELKEEIKIV